MNLNNEAREGLRLTMKQKRAEMPSAKILAASSAILDKLGQLPAINKARNIMAFAAMPGEVNLDQGIMEWHNEGKQVLLPKVMRGQGLQAIAFTGWEHTETSSFGIREPLGITLAPEQIEVVIVPGLVFDYKGFRLGYGKGYYDRFLSRLNPQAFFCGVCFDFQVVPTIYPHNNDVPVHWVVTDKSELVFDWSYF